MVQVSEIEKKSTDEFADTAMDPRFHHPPCDNSLSLPLSLAARYTLDVQITDSALHISNIFSLVS